MRIWYNLREMTTEEKLAARADIEATDDLLERALKLAGLLATLFQERGYPLVVVGGSAVEFYTEGCRSSARQMMCAALNDASFDWAEAERLADLRDFKVLPQLRALKEEISRA